LSRQEPQTNSNKKRLKEINSRHAGVSGSRIGDQQALFEDSDDYAAKDHKGRIDA
jgi:hypothetical protein